MQIQSSEELVGMTSSELLGLLDEARDAARIAGLKWAEAEKEFKDAKELLPSIFAEYARLYSVAGAKAHDIRWKVAADKGYQAKVKEMNQLEYAARLCEVEYKGWMRTMECLKSISYVRNNELKLAR